MHSFPRRNSLTKLLDTFIYPLNVFTPINASRETLTHICIPVATDYTAPNESLIQFFTLRFPHLSTLEFGGWNTVTPVGTALTNFLVAHPLIEHLTLGFADPNGWEVHCHVFPNASLGPSTLPNLRCLSVDASNLGTFVRSGMFSLQSLESLHIGVGYFKEEEDGGFANMYQALEAYGGLPGLKLLELELEGIINELGVARWILDLGKLFPKLEQFWGDYEVGKAAVSLFFCSDMSVCRGTHAPVTSSRSRTQIFLRPTLMSSRWCCRIPILGTWRRIESITSSS